MKIICVNLHYAGVQAFAHKSIVNKNAKILTEIFAEIVFYVFCNYPEDILLGKVKLKWSKKEIIVSIPEKPLKGV